MSWLGMMVLYQIDIWKSDFILLYDFPLTWNLLLSVYNLSIYIADILIMGSKP